MNRVHVVVGIVINKGRVLLTQRTASGTFPFLWEYPGGKAHPGETHATTLGREFDEELGEVVAVFTEPTPFFVEEFEPPVTSRHYTIYGYQVTLLGEPKPLVAMSLEWFGAKELADLPMTPASDRTRARLITLLEEQQ